MHCSITPNYDAMQQQRINVMQHRRDEAPPGCLRTPELRGCRPMLHCSNGRHPDGSKGTSAAEDLASPGAGSKDFPSCEDRAALRVVCTSSTLVYRSPVNPAAP